MRYMINLNLRNSCQTCEAKWLTLLSLSPSMANFIINSNSQNTKLQNTLFSPNYCQGLVSLDRSLMIAQTGLELSAAAGQSALGCKQRFSSSRRKGDSPNH